MTRVLITGGGRGIGRAIALRFAAAGGEVVVCSRSTPAEKLPNGIRFLPCDVRDATEVKRLFASFDGLDVLVNNAGVGGANPLVGDDELWHAILSTNLTGTYLCSKAALPLLPDGTGRIVNIASVLGLRGAAGATAYCAAKHGVVGFTRALALDLAPRGITVNAICPGWVDTEMAQLRFAELGMRAQDADAKTPTGRITAASEIAEAVFFLTRAAAGNITGQTLTIDGGATVGA